jgi:hypothetical protein
MSGGTTVQQCGRHVDLPVLHAQSLATAETLARPGISSRRLSSSPWRGSRRAVQCALWRATSLRPLRPRRRRPCTTAPSCSTSAWPTRTDDTRPTRPGPRRGSAQCHDGTTRPTSMGRFMRADGGGDDAALSCMKASGGPGT